jgi:superfamily II DNA helicase RecQ
MEFACKRPGYTNVVIATKAFGMGIDIANIRNIIHFSPTSSVLDYVQETGRSGRDGRPAKSILLYNKSDRNLLKFMLDKTLEGFENKLTYELKLQKNEVQALASEERSKKEKQLDSMFEYYVASGKECLRNFLQRYFRIESNSLQYKENYSITIRILRWLWLNLQPSDKPTSKEFAINSCCCFCNPEYSHALSRKAH